ncbi:MAG TPA: FAD-binding oxidoreductase [Pyrinomonadaceae bacterium]|nr:FAD-binding oxidoreductase [Pyrinomonadaceae bacterium]
MTQARSSIDTAIQALQVSMKGSVLKAADAGYDEARRIWNGRFDRHPGAIARCSGTADVIAAVNLAREKNLLVSVRSGGHDFAGNSVCDGGLVIDLSQMNGVWVDPSAKTARVQPGTKWRAFDHETQAFGLATTGATVSTVGVSGFTLGGGTGWLARKYGIALDNLIAVEVVTASGDLLRATENEHPDLFWALRGGGGNFGIVTSFEFRLHEVGREVLAGQIIYPFEATVDVLRFFRSFIAEAPDEVQCYPFFIRVPPLPVFPESFHGQLAIDLVVAHAGNLADGERVLSPLRGLAEPILDAVGAQPYLTLQQTFDAGVPAGKRWYSKAHYLEELSDAAIDTIVSGVAGLPGEYTMVYLEQLGGAIARIDPNATAFPHRSAGYSFHIFPGWENASDDERIIGWAREFHRELSAHATGNVYVNLLGGDEERGPQSAYGVNYDRLAKVKAKYDPQNFFRVNHNIEPSA